MFIELIKRHPLISGIIAMIFCCFIISTCIVMFIGTTKNNSNTPTVINASETEELLDILQDFWLFKLEVLWSQSIIHNDDVIGSYVLVQAYMAVDNYSEAKKLIEATRVHLRKIPQRYESQLKKEFTRTISIYINLQQNKLRQTANDLLSDINNIGELVFEKAYGKFTLVVLEGVIEIITEVNDGYANAI